MKRPLILLAVGLGLAQPAHTEEPTIHSIQMFKNGIAMVQAGGTTEKDGTTSIARLPHPVVGTFWIHSDLPATCRIERQSVPVPLSELGLDRLFPGLVGQDVILQTVHGEIRGRVIEVVSTSNRRSQGISYGESVRQTEGHTLYLESTGGRVKAVPASLVQSVDFEGVPQVEKEVPHLVMDTGESTAFEISYLARGISWVPAYRIELGDEGRMRLEQKAVVRNELADLVDVEFQVISGYPSILFAHVDSPFSASTGWADFFEQLSSRSALHRFPVTASNPASFSLSQIGNGGSVQAPIGVENNVGDGDGVDLHATSIGQHSLKEGESLSLSVDAAEVPFERIVEWTIPDGRDEDGRMVHERQRNQEPAKYDDTPWDAVSFANPFDSPLTTASAMLLEGGLFRGQQLMTWTNPGATTSVKVTKALTVSTQVVEREIPDSRREILVGNRRYTQSDVAGVLMIQNNRPQDAIIDIRRDFSGNLLEATQEPEVIRLKQSVALANERNQLQWRVTVPAGEQVTLEYSYRVLSL